MWLGPVQNEPLRRGSSQYVHLQYCQAYSALWVLYNLMEPYGALCTLIDPYEALWAPYLSWSPMEPYAR
jgi:hypothetical protein